MGDWPPLLQNKNQKSPNIFDQFWTHTENFAVVQKHFSARTSHYFACSNWSRHFSEGSSVLPVCHLNSGLILNTFSSGIHMLFPLLVLMSKIWENTVCGVTRKSFSNSNNFVIPVLSIYLHFQFTTVCFCWRDTRTGTEENNQTNISKPKNTNYLKL